MNTFRKFGNYHARKHEAFCTILTALLAEREQLIESDRVLDIYQINARIERVRRLRDFHYIKAKGL